MVLTKEIRAALLDAAETALWDGYGVAAIRVQDVPFEMGEMLHRSHIWDDGDDTGEELPGVCGIKHDLLSQSCQYAGSHVAVIAGQSYEYGEDAGEVIIHDAEVVYIYS